MDSYGLRLRLRLEGSQDESDDVWVYFLSDDVHQLGWGKKNKLRLNVPSGKFPMCTQGCTQRITGSPALKLYAKMKVF